MRLTPSPFFEPFNGLQKKDQTWVKTWFVGNDKGDWKNCYEKLLKATNHKAAKKYGTFSDSGKAWVCQREFNSLPDDITNFVDKDRNDKWLSRRSEGWEALNKLEQQFTPGDKSGINTEDKGPDTKKPLTSNKESLNEDFESLTQEEKTFVKNWFATNDKGDWQKCYEQLLKSKQGKKGKNRPYEVYGNFSENAKLFVCQREFNSLPKNVLEQVDKDVNGQWLDRRRRGEQAMEDLRKGWTKWDMDHIDATNTGLSPEETKPVDKVKKTRIQKSIESGHTALSGILHKARNGADRAQFVTKGQ